MSLNQQDAIAANVRVPLDQWIYNSGVRRRVTNSFRELVDVYLRPATQTIARGVEPPILLKTG